MNRNKIKIRLNIFLIFAPIVYILWLISPIEFIENGFSSILFCFFTFVYSICILILLNLIVYDKEVKVIKSIETLIKVVRIFLNVFFISCLLLFLYTALIASYLGGGYYEKTIFISKNNPDIKIILRGSNGGAWDSGFPVYRVIKVTPIINYFQIIKDIDTNIIDRNEWQRMK